MLVFPFEVTEVDMIEGGARAIVEYYSAVVETAGLASNCRSPRCAGKVTF